MTGKVGAWGTSIRPYLKKGRGGNLGRRKATETPRENLNELDKKNTARSVYREKREGKRTSSKG